MPLEDLKALGYEVHRPPEGQQPPTYPIVWGYGRQWTLLPGDDEETLVREIANHKTLLDKMETAQGYFADNYANWPTMNNAQKDNANRQAQRALTNLIRYVRDDLSSGGD